MTERLYRYGKAKATNVIPQLEQSSSLLLAEKCILSIEDLLSRQCLDHLSAYQETLKRLDDVHRCRAPTYLEFKSDPGHGARNTANKRKNPAAARVTPDIGRRTRLQNLTFQNGIYVFYRIKRNKTMAVPGHKLMKNTEGSVLSSGISNAWFYTNL